MGKGLHLTASNLDVRHGLGSKMIATESRNQSRRKVRYHKAFRQMANSWRRLIWNISSGFTHWTAARRKPFPESSLGRSPLVGVLTASICLLQPLRLFLSGSIAPKSAQDAGSS